MAKSEKENEMRKQIINLEYLHEDEIGYLTIRVEEVTFTTGKQHWYVRYDLESRRASRSTLKRFKDKAEMLRVVNAYIKRKERSGWRLPLNVTDSRVF